MSRLSSIPMVVLVVVTAGLWAACRTEPTPGERGEVRYVVTIPPLAMILAPLVEGRGRVETLLDPGASPHTYELRPSDVRAVEGSVALVYTDPHLDGWAADLPTPRRLALVPLVPDAYRLSAPGGAAGAHEGETDPHVWTDPLAVRVLLPALTDSLCAYDAGGCSTYRANADTLATRLEALDARLRTMMRPVRHTPVMLSQPFFRYFMHRYALELVAVIEPQPAKEPSPRQIQRLVAQAGESKVQVVFVQAQLPPSAARAVAEAAGIPIATLDPLGGVEGRQTYEELLLYDAEVILRALR